jgi:hypothetical protein
MPLTDAEDHDEKAKMIGVRRQIEQLLRDADLCGDVVIGGRGRVEVFMVMDASWSRVSLVQLSQGVALHVKAKFSESDDKAKLQADLEYTAGMISTLAEIKMREGLAWSAASSEIDERAGAAHTPLRRK